MSDNKTREEGTIYCPICQRDIEGELDPVYGGYFYYHDAVEHDDSDLEALDYAIQ